jgi:tetratricopeptide (TPR) repeat protein
MKKLALSFVFLLGMFLIVNAQSGREYMNMGFAQYEKGQYADAIVNYKKAIDAEKAIGNANSGLTKSTYTNMGLAYAKQKNYKEAINCYNTVLQMDPVEFSKAYKYRGIAKYESNDVAGALSDFNSAIKTNSNDAESMFYRGQILLKQGKKSEACADFTKGAELNWPACKEAKAKNCK